MGDEKPTIIAKRDTSRHVDLGSPCTTTNDDNENDPSPTSTARSNMRLVTWHEIKNLESDEKLTLPDTYFAGQHEREAMHPFLWINGRQGWEAYFVPVNMTRANVQQFKAKATEENITATSSSRDRL